jgi:dihydrofolate synthase/folylpolyglutamate synthase
VKIGNIDEALDYLYSFINYETDSSYSYEPIHYNVDRTIRLLDLLGNPQNGLKIIHVAGTKGKGSVCQILNNLLGSLDYIIGVFTSPHIDRVNERITVKEQQIKDEEFIDLINIIYPLIESFPVDSKPTTFEILTAMAAYYFKMKGVEFAILETGMGGRFDSTNFSNPVLSVITSISYDHVDKLGEHIHQIAAEKAGIIKKSKPVVVGYQVYDVLDIFKRKSVEEGCVCYSTGELCSYNIVSATETGTLFNTNIDGLALKNIFISLPGEHQVENAVLALHALKILGLLPKDSAIRKALENIHMPARLELIVKDRRYLLDSAHNEDSSRVLVRAVKNAYNYNKLVTVVGIVKGKDIQGILKNIASISDSLIITEPVTHKDLDTENVYKKARELYPSAVLKKGLKYAVEYAAEISGGDDLILITGSFYTTSPARSMITAKTAGRLPGTAGRLPGSQD